jgi:tricorn protease
LILTTATLALSFAMQGGATPEMRLMRWPAIHGDNIVFTYGGDLWLSKTDGGYARRLTSHPGLESNSRISPDGKWVAFTANYEGNPDAFVMPIEGGEPKRLTFEPNNDNVIGWTKEGKIMVASTAGNFLANQQRLWLLNPEGGPAESTKVLEIAQGSFLPDGKTLAYTRFSSYNFNWRRYRGGSQGRISLFDLEANKYWELPSGREQSYFPMTVGNSIYYISDKKLGTHNFYRYDVDSKKETQLTQFNDADIKWPSTDGKKIIYERDGYLWTYEIAGGKIQRLDPTLRSDFVTARPYLRRLGTEISSISLSPSGNRVAVEARGELFSLPAKAGDTRNFTGTQAARERFPSWSPDGKTIAYVSDASGAYEVYTQPQMGGTPTKLTDAKLAPSALDWTPDSKLIAISTETNDLYLLDVTTKKLTQVYKSRYGSGANYDVSSDSKWIAYIDQAKNGFGQINLYEIATGKSTQVTDGYYDDTSVSFDTNGKYLYFVSRRTFNPSFGDYEFSLKVEKSQRIYAIPLTKDLANPYITKSDEEPAGQPATPPTPGDKTVKVDFDGISARAIVLPLPNSNYNGVIGADGGVMFVEGGALKKIDMGGREAQTIIAGLTGPLSFNASRTKMAYLAQGVLGILPMQPGQLVGGGRVDTSSVTAVIDPKQEWTQIFWDAWRFEKYHFYDPNMVGLDWNALGQRYAKYLPYVSTRLDLNYVLGLLLSELGTGHSYVQGGDFGNMGTSIPVGQLGADYEISGNAVRFKKIYRGANFEESRRGPLGEPGVDVRDGDYLLEVDGKPVDKHTNPNSLLVDKVGKTVTLTVNSSPSTSGARKVRVRPIGNESEVRYYEFVESNRKWVDKMSGGRIGYMHVPNTQFQGAVEFTRGYWSQTDKDAMVVDERWNGGGYIQPWFVDTLARQIKAGIQIRNAKEDAFDAAAIEGPKVMLINGYAGSGGDFFPWMFKAMKVGPLIGTRTWGGLVGISSGAPLVDGGGVTAPEFSIYNRETGEIIAENQGVAPDIDVDARPDLIAQGRDPQLEKAVEVLMEKLKNMPPKKKRTDIPKIGKDGRIGG